MKKSVGIIKRIGLNEGRESFVHHGRNEVIFELSKGKNDKEKFLKTDKRLQMFVNFFKDYPLPMAFLDSEFEFVFYNASFSEWFTLLFKIKLKEKAKLVNVLGKLPEKQSEIMSACRRAVIEKNEVLLIIEIQGRSHKHCQLTFKPIFNEESTCLGVAFGIDVLSVKDRLNEQSEITAILAHEISQPLMAMSSYTEGCMTKLAMSVKEINDVLNVMQHVVKQVDYAGEVVHSVKNFMHKDKINYENHDINELITYTSSLLKYELAKSNIKLCLDLKPKLPILLVNKVHIEQVIFNLIRNSIEAIQAAEFMVEPIITVRSYKQKGFVVVEVSDNGPGFGKTAEMSLDGARNSGLGLLICQMLIKAHKGVLSFKVNRPTDGACVSFSLPVLPVESMSEMVSPFCNEEL